MSIDSGGLTWKALGGVGRVAGGGAGQGGASEGSRGQRLASLQQLLVLLLSEARGHLSRRVAGAG